MADNGVASDDLEAQVGILVDSRVGYTGMTTL